MALYLSIKSVGPLKSQYAYFARVLFRGKVFFLLFCATHYTVARLVDLVRQVRTNLLDAQHCISHVQL